MKRLLFHEIHQTSRLSIHQTNEELKEFGLFSTQWSVLFCLQQFGEMTQKEIWAYLNVEAPTVTRTLARLEETGWVIRKEGKDKRERIVALSGKARETVPQIEQRIEQLERKLLSELSDAEQEQLIGLLQKIGGRNKEEEGEI
ncbi:MarR family winged helix-turn-helix transcriptional regulator [Planomicrobium sp. YIM 101495]|uniref:MarR family winged helix-turn-helix transcriptional regulator n=1 Tax=Planomicrobium sp. YIM 101495 TaxID=2665160 RepID=UPI0012B8FF97|nr:MarR family transcriptional regulator [Planomicrobium sp. YIM 101495]MTD31456.1 MarR family transcriptional regulator [Planomicrobium sp. YIM 101495]